MDNGPGINEREFVKELLSSFRGRVTCVAPQPSQPENYFDQDIEYVVNHRGYNPFLYLVYMISTILRVIRLHRRQHFSALVFRLDLIALEPWVLAKVLGVPVILKTLAGYTRFSDLGDWKQKLVAVFAFPIYRSVARMAVASDTVSVHYVRWLVHRFGVKPDRIGIVYNGTNLTAFSPGNKSDERKKLGLESFPFIVGYVGALSTLRNVDILIRALAQVNRTKNVGLVLVGNGPDRKILESLAEQMGISDKVRFVGAIPYSMVPGYMRSFDVAVDLTYVAMKIGNEVFNASYSQKIPQYLACGLPVIAFDVEDNKFLEREKIGALVKIGDEDSIVDAVMHLLEMEDSEREGQSRNAKTYAEQNFGIASLARKRISLWDDVLQKLDESSKGREG